MNQTRTKTTNSLTYKTLTIALLALLCLGGNRAWAWAPGGDTQGGQSGTYYLRTNTNYPGHFDVYKDGYSTAIATNVPNIDGFTINSGTVEFVFENTETITLNGQIFINANAGTQAHFIMRLGTPHNNGTPAAITLKITGMSPRPGSDQNVVFFLNKGKGANAGEHSITIQGNDDSNSSTTDPSGLSFANNFVIDGDGPTLTAVGASTMSPQVNSGPGNIKNYGMFRVQQGSLHLKNVTVQNFSTSWGNGGMAQVFTSNATDAIDLEFNHCLFKSIGASSTSGSPVLRMQGSGGTNLNRDARLVNCRFIDIFNANWLAANSTLDINNNNATIRTLGNNKTKLSLVNCHITQNYGCPVRWHGCASSEPIVIKGCLVENNFTYSDGNQAKGGGGLLLKGPATITSCTIRNNRTNGSGGGIYVSTYVDFNPGTPDLIPEHTIVRLDPNTKVHGNVAQNNGGGVAIEANLMKNTYYSALTPYSYYIYFTPSGEPFKTQFIQNGGQVYNNTALGDYGGGVYISRSNQTPFYEVICSLDYGKVYGNTATNGKGGGVAVKTYNDTETQLEATPPADVAAQDVIVEMSYQDADPTSTSDASKMLIYGNEAIDGGGVYVEAYENTLPNNPTPNKVEVNVYGLAKVSNNTATNNGGGLYVEYGTVRINSGTIGGSTTEVTTTPVPSNGGNTAGLDGGGIYLNTGNIFTDVAAHAEPTGGGSGAPLPTPHQLAPGYIQLEYIQSTDHNQYINTGINLNYAYTLYIDALLPDFTAGAGKGATLFWAGVNNENNWRMGCGVFNSGKITGSWGNNWKDPMFSKDDLAAAGINVADRFQLLQNYEKAIITQGSPNLEFTMGGTSTGNNINRFIFIGRAERSAMYNNAQKALRIFQFKIWSSHNINPESETGLLRNLYPCKREEDGAIGMYDSISGVFYPNAGTGSFAAGPEVMEDRGNASVGGHSAASPVLSSASRRGGSRAATAGATISYNKADRDGGGGYVNNGNLFLMQTKVDHNTATNGRGGGLYTNAGNVFVNYWDAHDPAAGTNYTVRGEANPSQIMDNTAGTNGGGVNTHSGLVYMRGQSPTQDIIVSGNKATNGSGGGIFCMGAGNASTEYVRLINVNMTENKATNGTGSTTSGSFTVSNGCGGGVYLQQGTIEIRKCKLTGNTAHVNGGGINNHSGIINVKGAEINGNKAGVDGDGNESSVPLCSGGGIFTVHGDVYLNNYTDGTSIYHRTVIQGNSAKSNGGGITTRQGKVKATGEYQADHSKHILISGNTATQGSGGGVFCLGDPTTSGVNYIDFTNVDMINNKAANGNGGITNVTLEDGTTTLTVTNGCGGGIYLQEGGIKITNSDLQNNYANYNGGGINNHSGSIVVKGCLIGGDTYFNNGGTGHGNKANHSGGGIYTNRGNIVLMDNVMEGNGSHVHIESKVSHNEAVENGGGMDTRAGQVLVNFNDTTGVQYYRDYQIEITYNKAKKGGGIYANAGTIIAANALIDNNTATENGGGINNHAGNITVYGGSLSNNKAREGKGGGVFTMVGDIDILPFPVGESSPTLNHGTKVYNNIAKLNGGGINNHIGLVDARHASIRNNTSTLGNGGGIYCEGPHSNTTGFTIRLQCSELMQNKTRGQDGTAAAPTGRGGGIYLKYGSIYAHASQILYNEANINGGGIDNHEGDMLLYGCDLIGNKALTGRGGGIYTHAGDITTGPCISRTDANKSRATVIQQNVAHINGGGINNHQGNIYLNGDLIGGLDNSDPANPVSLGNVAETGHGGGIYISNGVIDMFGGNISYNTAAKGDGGGVWSGGGEFNIQKRQGKPVIEIVDIDTIGANKACIHYHVIDKGGDNSTTLTEHGIKWGTGSPTTQVTFSTSTTGHYNGDEAGCHRIVVSGLTAGTTYYAAAYATNSKNLSNQCDSVPFTTRNNIPVVITGTISEITFNEAKVYSKLVDSVGITLEKRGVVWGKAKNALNNEVESQEKTDFFLTEITNSTDPNEQVPPGDTVWLAAFAKNANGFGYGDTIYFVSPKDLPDMGTNQVVVSNETANSATFSFTMPSGTDFTELKAYGFVISTDDDPEIHADGEHTVVLETHTGTTFSTTFTGLEPSTTYYVRAFASKIENPGTDVSNYAVTTPVQFITPSADGKPVVRAVDISGITRTEATIHGELVHKGNANITKYGVCYSTSSTTPTEHGTNCQHIDLSGTWEEGTIKEFGLGNLQPNTTYYLRLYATNSTATDPAENDIAYSNPFNFTTLPQSLPSVAVTITSEKEADPATTYKATVSCKVHNGGSAVTEYGIYWGATDNPTTEINKDDLALSYNATTGIYTVSLTGLNANTKYYVKAYATNAVGTFTGRVISFTTDFTKPTFKPVEIIAVNYDPYKASTDEKLHSIVVKGSFDDDGTPDAAEYGFVYSDNNQLNNLTIEAVTTNEWDCGSVVGTENVNDTLFANVNGNKRYYIRPYAKTVTAAGDQYTYGDTLSVITLPEVRRGSNPTDITDNGAKLHGHITDTDAEGFLTHYGFCWKKATDQDNPTPPASLTINDNDNDGTITAAITNYSAPYTFDMAITGLKPGTKYYWRAFVKNKKGNVAYSTNSAVLETWDHYITTAVSPSGAGTVSGGGGYETAPITLTATAATGYAFSHWDKNITTDGENYTETPNCSTANPLTINSNETGTYTANFNGTVSWTVNGTGTVSATAGVSSNGAGVASGTSVTLTATPTETGIDFAKWIDSEGEVVSTIATYTFTMGDAPVSLTAVFSDGRGRSTSAATTQNGASTGSASTTMHTSRPRDIYPAPAREPWDWDEDDFTLYRHGGAVPAMTTVASATTERDSTALDSLSRLAEQLRNRGNEVAPTDIPIIIRNQATEGKGGGIYMTNADPNNPPTELIFSGGSTATEKGRIIYNYAKEAGGGIYIDSAAYMQMKGHCEVNANWVPKNKLGGGIYLAGRLYVGENRDDQKDKHALSVTRNFAKNFSPSTITDTTAIHALYKAAALTTQQKMERNNIMLPRNTYDFNLTGSSAGDDQSTVITLLSDISAKNTEGKPYSQLGFSVNNGFCPVIATSTGFPNHYMNQGEVDADGYRFNKYDAAGVETTVPAELAKVKYEPWLSDLMPTNSGAVGLSDDGAIFEDSETYIAIHTNRDNQPFRAKYIYLWGSWTNPAVSKDPEYLQPMYGGEGEGDNKWLGHYIIKNSENKDSASSPDTLTIPSGKEPEILEWEIYSEEGLSWFSSYVNGLNAFAEGDTYTAGGNDTIHRKYNKNINPYAKAKIMNDLDMEAHLWVPIGSVTKYAGAPDPNNPESTIYEDQGTHNYKGEFDGQGHIIRGLDGRFLTGITKYGLFGHLDSTALVKNVFIDESQFITDKEKQTYYIGGISGRMSGNAVLAGVEARAKIDTKESKGDSYVGGLVGKVEDGQDSPQKRHVVIHSSMAMPEIYGGAKHVGGLVGYLGVGDTLVNSFSNPSFPEAAYRDTVRNGSTVETHVYYGGLVGINKGLVENCYSRLQSREPKGRVSGNNIYGWLAGTNNGAINYTYALADSIKAPHNSMYYRAGTEPVGHYAYGTTTRLNDKYGFDHCDQQIFKNDGSEPLAKPATPGSISDNEYIQNGILFGLLPTLDNWVDSNAVATNPKRNYAHWARSLASPINDDYPLLMLQDFTALGSEDQIYIKYGSTDKLLGDYNTMVAANATAHPNVFIYDGDTVTESNADRVKVYIDENVGITQSAGSNLTNVRVGITFDNSSGNDLGDAFYDWHMFSTPLVNPPTGLVYKTNEGTNYPILVDYETLKSDGITEGDYANKSYMDPPKIEWNKEPGEIGYFPTNTEYGTNYHNNPTGAKRGRDYTKGAFDFYMYGEAYHQHWINFKREGAYENGSAIGFKSTVGKDFFDHWHEDAFKNANGEWMHYQIKYENEKYLIPGRGYMMAINEKWEDLQDPSHIVDNPERHNMLMTDGNLRNDNIEYKATHTIYDSPVGPANDYDLEVRGTNLIGNPYQSYLDANKFFEANGAVGGTYFVVDADHYGYIAYPENASHNPGFYASPYIHPHQGFFVKVGSTTPIRFTNEMRVKGKTDIGSATSEFRGHLNYPLVNLTCTDANGMRDYTTVEINRPDPEKGAPKMHRLRTGNALIYARHNDQSYQVAFIPEGVTTVPVRFQAFADGEYKLNWSTLHGEFSYLHLIDNMAGKDVDCLRETEYRFTATTDDYLSRFKLVFQCVGLDEQTEDDDTANVKHFAFQNGDEVIVIGSGRLEVFDLLGHCLMSTTLSGETNSVSLPGRAAAIYLLRLTDSKQTKVQKMVIH